MEQGRPEEFIWCLVLVLMASFLLRLLLVNASRAHARSTRGAVLVGLWVRWLTGVLIYYLAPAGAFAEDPQGYALSGKMLADHWRGLGGIAPGLQMKAGFFYAELNGAVFTAGGFAPLLMVTLNCIVGALTVWLAYRVAAELVGRDAAVRAAWLTALFPSLILWSSMNLRDVWVLLAFLSFAFAIVSFGQRRWDTAVLAAVIGTGDIYLFRPYLVPLVAAGLLAGAMLSSARRPSTTLIMGALLGVGVLALAAYLPAKLLPNIGVDSTLQQISAMRRNLGTGGSAYLQQVRFHSARDVLGFLPIGMAYFMLSPFPWLVSGFRQLITLPEMLVWYWLIPRVIRGIRVAFRRSPSETLTLLSLVVCLAIPYSIVSANMGTAYRHRAQVLVFLLIFAAAGLARTTAREDDSVVTEKFVPARLEAQPKRAAS